MKKTAAFNCPWDLSPSNIVRICATSLLRHLTKIGYSSRFARVLCTNSVKDARARTRSNSTIFVRIPSRVNWVKLVFPTRKPRHSNRHLMQNVSRCGKKMNFLTASLLSTKGLIAQRLKTKYARKTCHVVLLLKAALWSKKVKSNSSTLRSPLGRSLTTNPMSSVRMKDKYLIDNWVNMKCRNQGGFLIYLLEY